MQGIYKIQNNTNGKVYIGSSTDIEKEFQKIIKALDNHHCRIDYSSLGTTTYRLIVIEEIEDKDQLPVRLEHYTKLYSNHN